MSRPRPRFRLPLSLYRRFLCRSFLSVTLDSLRGSINRIIQSSLFLSINRASMPHGNRKIYVCVLQGFCAPGCRHQWHAHTVAFGCVFRGYILRCKSFTATVPIHDALSFALNHAVLNELPCDNGDVLDKGVKLNTTRFKAVYGDSHKLASFAPCHG